MAVRPVVLAKEAHAQLIRQLFPNATITMDRRQLTGATLTGSAVAFISHELLSTVDPSSILSPVVVIIDTEPKSSLQDTVRTLLDFPWVSHVLAAALLKGPSAATHLATLFERLEVGADQRQLGATGRGRKALLTSASRREARFERIRTFFENQAVPSRTIETMLDASEELVMNALYDAPLEAGYFERAYQRSEDVELPDHLACEISYGVDGDTAFVCLRDPFGSLTRPRLLETLNRCKADGGNVELDDSRGGAGLGLWRIISGASTLAIHVIPGTLTEIFVGFSITEGRKGLRPAAVDLFFSRNAAAEDPFAPYDDMELLDRSISIILVA